MNPEIMKPVNDVLRFLYPQGLYAVAIIVFIMGVMKFKGVINTPLREVLFTFVTIINAFILGYYDSAAVRLGNNHHEIASFGLIIISFVLLVIPSPQRNKSNIR